MTFDLDSIGRGLPVAEALPALTDALASGAVVVQAPPGTGKTTLVPPAVANLVSGRVIVTQPRRVAARAAARRVAHLAGVRLGDEVGYVVRGDQRVSSGTRVEFCTAGVLLRRLLNDPELTGVGAVILDEVHERALETDLAFAMLVDLRALRPDLVAVVMSATLDAERWASLLGGAPIVAVESALHPLEVRWAPSPAQRLDARGVTPGFLDHLAAVAADALGERGRTVLAFVPGARECDRVVERLVARGIAAEPLHGSLDARAQDRALRPTDDPRVVVATSLAESSLTVPGVHTVVDSGLSREPRYDSGRGMSGLVTVSEARSSAEQRAGRAARLGPGLVIRCFPETDWPRLRPFVAPEIQSADLVQTALDLACWGTPGGVGLALPDAPPAAALDTATDVLLGLGALARTGEGAADVRPTDLGRRLAALPVAPRLGRALLTCAHDFGARPVAEVVAMLAGDERAPGGDLLAHLRALRRTMPGPWRREADRLERLAGGGVPTRPNATDEAIIAAVVASAWPDRLARARGEGASDYLTTGGTGLELPRGTTLAGASWLAVADMDRVGERAVIRAAVRIDEAAARASASGMLTERVEATWASGRVTARRIVALGAIELSSTPVKPTPDQGADTVRRALSEHGLRETLAWNDDAERLRRRLALLHHVLGDPWPAVADADLIARADDWLGPELRALADGTPASRLDLVGALRRLLPWPAASRFDELAPERLEVPTGSRIRLDYPDDPADRVVLAVKLQECFGLLDTPRLVDGRVPVLMHLLSPAQRPLAVTDDLASFWVNAYQSVRAENRGRYSKHPWPEDPLTAPPRRGTTRSGR